MIVNTDIIKKKKNPTHKFGRQNAKQIADMLLEPYLGIF